MLKFMVAFMVLSFMGCAGLPKNLGVSDGKLRDCPKSPNCVSTFGKDSQHAISGISYFSSLQKAKSKLRAIIENMPRSKFVRAEENYLHVEFRSAFIRFVDDVEFYFDDTRKIIHFRSASRIGHSDFGVNRARMEKIRKAFIE